MQLSDFNEENFKAALSLKADFMDAENDVIILQNDIETNKRGFRTLLLSEPYFFFINDSFVDIGLFLAKSLGDNFSYRKLSSLKKIPTDKKIELAKNYIYQEQMRRGYRFDYYEYQEILETEDLLLREASYNYLLDSPYMLYSISYLKTMFSNYYQDPIKDNYLYTILKVLSKDNSLDTDSIIAINSTMELFDNETKNSKIITFSKKI